MNDWEHDIYNKLCIQNDLSITCPELLVVKHYTRFVQLNIRHILKVLFILENQTQFWQILLQYIQYIYLKPFYIL